MKKIFKYIIDKFKKSPDPINEYIQNGRVPWTRGYLIYRNKYITDQINSVESLRMFNQKSIESDYGQNLDERVVEYPYLFSCLHGFNGKILDAGSTFNYEFILNQAVLCNPKTKLTILTYAPEKKSFTQRGISYLYSDLRDIPIRDEFFDCVVSQSTIEHIDMDNSIYGYDISNSANEKGKSYEYLFAIREMLRVLKKGGRLLITFPFGKFENHEFFQQFDDEMLAKAEELLNEMGEYELTFFKYEQSGWRFAARDELGNVKSYNPHTGRGRGEDGAAHCRSVCCIEFIKQK
ncbi:MAG: methyltransferase domain-containing protein [Fulvivirga sp.]|uniref:methyltransferase domain-containing protein n=1 Tax=Fulvivirga sp. TaxID=1931237 RepID=UPI0032EB3ABB